MKKIQLSQGKYATIDNDDFELIKNYNWFAHKSPSRIFYAETHTSKKLGKRKTIKMHRLLLNAAPKQFVDHRDGNGLNNSRSNIRIATAQQNQMNRVRSKNEFKGVSWHKRGKKWQSSIRFNRKDIYLGLFKNKEDAAKAYDKKAKELFGEFACTNF